MPDKYLAIGIDGTGSSDWRRPDGANSHIYRFITDINVGVGGNIEDGVSGPTGAKRYWHGPNTLATNLPDIIEEAYNFTLQQTSRLIATGCTQSEVKICLVGHSRGCVGAIKVANNINDPSSAGLRMALTFGLMTLRAPIAVGYLGLYDSVNKSLVDIDAAVPNVAAGRHARRKNRSWSGSRWSFDTVDTPRFPPHDYDTAHGGIGGDPGYFTALGGMTADYYCNAWQLILTQAELNTRYGYVASRAGVSPRYRPLSGDEATAKRALLRRSIAGVPGADAYIRAGAVAAGFSFTAPASNLASYGTTEANYYQRMVSAVTS